MDAKKVKKILAVLAVVDVVVGIASAILDIKAKAKTEEKIRGLEDELDVTREALKRSYTTSTKLREEHIRMRDTLEKIGGNASPILSDIPKAPKEDSLVEVVAQRSMNAEELTCTTSSANEMMYGERLESSGIQNLDELPDCDWEE